MKNRWPMALGLLLGLGALSLGLVVGADRVEGWQLAARWTSRAGFPLLMLAYVARPLTQIWRSDIAKALLKRRKYFGLGFALSHTVHLVALIIYLQISGLPAPILTLYGGGAGYVILYAMALTSNRAAMQAMGKWWKRLHTLGIHSLWFIYLVSYSGRLFDPETLVLGGVTMTILVGVAAVRFAAWIKTRKRRAAATA